MAMKLLRKLRNYINIKFYSTSNFKAIVLPTFINYIIITIHLVLTVRYCQHVAYT